ncbi:MAG TPA: AAA family ATPase [Opitutus sp.]|nr:AAA family ATPase [Opitutus sp.]
MSVTEAQRENLLTLPTRLKGLLTGQDSAIDLVAERLQHGELGLTMPGRPKASFLFLGPTGVGKTELTLRFTEDLIGPGRAVRLDMSEYQTADRLALLLGTSDGEPGRIAEGFDACAGRGTLLFDEIEKAHPRVLDVLLQLLDAARLTTGRNRVLDFSDWYVVLTSNIGAQRIMTLRKSKFETMERLVRQDAQRELRPEIFARITVSVVFNNLDYAQCEIAGGMTEKECGALATRGFVVFPENSVTDVIIQRGYYERLGARPMRDATELLIRNALAHHLLHGGVGAGRLKPDADGMKLQLEASAS